MAFEWLQGAGTLIGGLGQVYGAYNQNKQSAKQLEMMNKQNDIVNKQYDKMNKLYEEDRNRSIKKEEQTQLNLDTAIENVYGTKKKDNSLSFDLGV